MLSVSDAKQILHGPKLAERDQLLVILSIEPTEPISVNQIRERCVVAGISKLAKKNISDILGKSHGAVARTVSGWELQQEGIKRVRDLARAVSINLVVSHSSGSLRGHSEGIADPLTKILRYGVHPLL